jgi:ABC-type transporter Mla subunit MlaD
MRRKLEIEMQAGIFIFIGLVAAMITILMMGGGQSLFEKTYKINLTVSDTAGLAKGGSVSSGGVKIGVIDEIKFSDNYEDVRIILKISESARQRIREDSVVRFQTQGVLGDKYLEVLGGSPDKPPVPDGGSIQVEQGKDLSAVFAEGSTALGLLKDNLANLKVLTSAIAKRNQMESIMKDLADTSANLKDISQRFRDSNAMAELGSTMKNLRVATDKIKNGEGTIGALVNDASLYEDLKNLIGGANRNTVLKFFVRQAVKSSDDAAAKAEAGQKSDKADKKNPNK